MKSRGLLTERDREILLGEADGLPDQNKRQIEIRHLIRQRTENLVGDLGVLREANETKILDRIVVSSVQIGLDEIKEKIDQIETELYVLEREHEKVEEISHEVAEIKRQLSSIDDER